MNKNLLIVGAGAYGVVAVDTAHEMECFEKIDFVDDENEFTPMGEKVIGKIKNFAELNCDYSNIIVAIDLPDIRLNLLAKIQEETNFRIITLVSPKAYVSPPAQIMSGCIIEPMAIVHYISHLATGCFVFSGAVVNYASMCCDGVHVEANSTIVA